MIEDENEDFVIEMNFNWFNILNILILIL